MKSSTAGSSSQSSLPQKVSLKSERDVQMRRAAFHASASVVSITSYSGEEQKHHVSGTVIQSKFVDNVFKGTVLTSATLIRDDPGANTIMKDLKIRVRLWNRSLVHGSLLTFDLHYNVAIIEIQVHDELRVTNFRLLDDSYDLDDNMNLPEKKKRSFEFDVYGKPQKISAGDTVFILGRFHKQPFNTLISSGEFSLHPCYYDCKELFKINGKIKKCGIGGPVVNLRGEVLGLAHCNEYFIPFLPSNVICRLLDYYESKGQFRHPWIGMEVLNLHHSNLDGEWVEVFRGRRKSIVIEKVDKNSPADKGGLCSKDLILKCDGQDITGILQFNKMIWDKDGEFKLKVLRPPNSEPMDVILVPEECKPEAFNSWTLSRERSWTLSREHNWPAQ